MDINNWTRTFRIRSIYRVIQEKRSIFLEVTVSVIFRKRVHTDVYLCLNSYQDRAVWICNYTSTVNDKKREKLSTPNIDVRKSVHHHTIKKNQPARCNNFTSLLFESLCVAQQFRAPLRPTSGAYNCTRSLRFYRWRVAVGALLVVVWQVNLLHAALHTVSFVHGCFAGKCILTGSTE
jgi:hypothetical protein